MVYERVSCPECGEEYGNLGRHWHYSPSHRPDFTERQKDIIVGSLMGDGCLQRQNKTSHITLRMISNNYLEWIDNIFGCLSTGVKMYLTAKESAKKNRDRGFRPNAKEENYNNMYRLNTRQHPFLNNFNSWYETGKKVWPEDIELTPTTLLHFYVQDGTLQNSNNNKPSYISIAAAKEIDNYEKIDSYFKNRNLPTPHNYVEGRTYRDNNNMDITFTVDQSKDLWNYMLSGQRETPPPDFEYKFPEKYH